MPRPKRDMRVDVCYDNKWFHTTVSSEHFRHAIAHTTGRGSGYLPSTSQDHIAIQIKNALKKMGIDLHYLEWDEFTVRVCKPFEEPTCKVTK